MRSSLGAALCCLLLAGSFVERAWCCTTFCLDSPDGPVFGANLDLFIPGDGLVFINQRGVAKSGFGPSTTGVVVKWVSRYGSVTFNLAGREWAFSGMNEAGLVLSSMELLRSQFPERDERPSLPIGPWAQYILDTCGSVREAINAASRVRIEDAAPPVHFLIADADGNGAAIEWVDGKLVCHTGGSLPVKAMTNMRYRRALAAYERGGPKWWWSNPGESAERFAAAQARNESFNADADTTAVEYAFETLTHVVAAPHTRWNIVYDVPKREVWFRSVQSPAVKHLALGAFDLSCGGPVLMLDVNAALDGDVGDAFVPYDHDVNLAAFRTLCARYEIDVSEDAAFEIVRHIESFACAH
jgi:penicillin V acylase-like amidase (Ntn superfamily)